MSFGARFHQIGTVKFSWLDLLCYVQTCPPSSHLFRAINGEHYGYEVRIAAMVLEALRVGNWLNSKPGSRRPKAIVWPWLKDEDTETFGKAAPVTDIRDFLLFRNGHAPVLKE